MYFQNLLKTPRSMFSVHSHQGWQFSLMGSPPLKSFLRGCSGWRTGGCLCLCWPAKWTLSLWSSSPYILAPTHLSWSLHNPLCQRRIHTYTALDSRSIRIPPEWQMEKWCSLDKSLAFIFKPLMLRHLASTTHLSFCCKN